MKFTEKEIQEFNIKIVANNRKRCGRSDIGEALLKEDGYLLIKQGGYTTYDSTSGYSGENTYARVEYRLFKEDKLIAVAQPGKKGKGFVKLVTTRAEAPRKHIEESAKYFAKRAIKHGNKEKLVLANGICHQLALAELFVDWSVQDDYISPEKVRAIFRAARKIVDNHFYPEG